MLLTDLQYFGTISYIQTIFNNEHIVLDTKAPFTKMSFKNRTIIATAQGPLHLSIPIIGGRDQKTPIDEILIAYDSPWREQHFKAMYSSYKRAPFFEYYEASLQNLFEERPTHLIQFLLEINSWIKKQIKGNWEIAPIDSINKNNFEKFYDSWLPKNYNQIINPIQYQQVFENKTGFLPNLSILDLLFCCGGKHASVLLKSS